MFVCVERWGGGKEEDRGRMKDAREIEAEQDKE